MESLECDICPKVIEGYNSNHVAYLMKQHKLTHEKDISQKTREKEILGEEGDEKADKEDSK